MKHFTTLLIAPLLLTVAHAATINVEVGSGGLNFAPANPPAINVGDTVT